MSLSPPCAPLAVCCAPAAPPAAPPVGALGRGGGESVAAVVVDAVAEAPLDGDAAVLALPLAAGEAAAAAVGDAVGEAGEAAPLLPVDAGDEAAVLGVAELREAAVDVFRTAGAGVTLPDAAVSRVVAPARATARVAASSRLASEALVEDFVFTCSSDAFVTGLGVVLSLREARAELAARAESTFAPLGCPVVSVPATVPAAVPARLAESVAAATGALAAIAVVSGAPAAALSSVFSAPLQAITASASTEVATRRTRVPSFA